MDRAVMMMMMLGGGGVHCEGAHPVAEALYGPITHNTPRGGEGGKCICRCAVVFEIDQA